MAYQKSYFSFFFAAFFLVSISFAAPQKQTFQEPPASLRLSLDQRVQYQKLIEDVYWRHRIWPAENREPKPRLDAIMPTLSIQEKVKDALLKSAALEYYYHRSITGEMLQGELQRISSETKQPRVLRELWDVMGNNPLIIAECLGRPLLAERLLRESYSHDERFQGGLRARVQRELKKARTAADVRSMSGKYTEVEWLKDGKNEALITGPQNRLILSEEEWNQATILTKNLAPEEMSPLQEDSRRFYILNVLKRQKNSLKVAIVEWPKVSFEKWWVEARNQMSMQIEMESFPYHLPKIASTDCSNDTWEPMTSRPVSSSLTVWTGSELIVWGKLFGEFTGSRYDPIIDSWHPISGVNEPSPRNSQTTIWTGTEMIVWGGWGGGTITNIFDTGGRYNPLTDSWTATSTGANVPSARTLHTTVWSGSEMIVWGGLDANGQTDTGSRYDPVSDTWTPVNMLNAPGPRVAHVAVWTGTEMVIQGGVAVNTSVVTGGKYNPLSDSWIPTTTTDAPSPRQGPIAMWTGSEMIVWGGTDNDGFGFLNTGARYDPAGDTWIPTNINNAPQGRTRHTGIWTGSEMIIWGGCVNHDCSSHVDTGGKYNPVTDIWIDTSTINTPNARSSHSAQWTGTEMTIFGGCTGGECQIQLTSGARYNPASDTWIIMNLQDAPLARINHVAVWTGIEMIVWGGLDSFLESSGGRYDPVTDTWTDLSIIGTPNGRDGHSGVWTGTEMIIWGGRAFGLGNTLTGGRFNPTTSTWTDTNTVGAPTERAFHKAVWTGTHMVVWGGCFDEGCTSLLNTGGLYDPSTDSWTSTTTTGAPSARVFHSSQWSGTEMMIWGGLTSNFNSTNTGARYHPTANQWSQINLAGAPSSRYRHADVWTGNEMIVWGGFDGTNLLSTGGRYNPASDSWIPTATVDAPSSRSEHTAVWTSAEMIVWGGCADSICDNNFFTGGRYNPATDVWIPMSTNSAPSKRALHSAVWTDTEMLIWGGWRGSFGAVTKTGARYTACVVALPDVTISKSDSGASAVPGGDITYVLTYGNIGTTDANGVEIEDIVPANTTFNPGASTLGWVCVPDNTAGSTCTFTVGMLPAGSTGNITNFVVTVDNPLGAGVNQIDNTATISDDGSDPNLGNNTSSDSTPVNAAPDLQITKDDGGISSTSGGTIVYVLTVTNTASQNASGVQITDTVPANTTFDLANSTVGWNCVPNNNAGSVCTFTVGNLTGNGGNTAVNFVVIVAPPPLPGVLQIDNTASVADDGSGGPDPTPGNNTDNDSTPLSTTCLFCDDFEDGVLSTVWTYEKLAWSESGGDLIGTPVRRKAIAIATPAFSGCSLCTVTAGLSTAGGAFNKVWLFGWRVDKDNVVEVLMKEENNKWVLRQRVNRTVVAKDSGLATIDTSVNYTVQVSFDGTTFTLTVDGTVMATITAVGTPNGTVGFAVKNTTGIFEFISVN